MPKRLSAGGRPIGKYVKRVLRRKSEAHLLETDAEQLQIRMAIENRYAGEPDTGRVIPPGSAEFKRIAAELLARENKLVMKSSCWAPIFVNDDPTGGVCDCD